MEKQADPAPFQTPREAAKLLRLSTKTIRSILRRKELPAIKVGGQWRVRESELIKFIQGLEER